MKLIDKYIKDNGLPDDESVKEWVMQDCPIERDCGDFECPFDFCPCWDKEVSDDLDCRTQEVKELQEGS